MKANEFVEKFGLSHSKLFGNGWITFDDGCIENSVSRTDVKRLVESYELVMDYYGLTRAKEHAESKYTAPELKAALKQAILDVESCNE